MIQTYSSTIRRKEMEAVLTCMVDEKIGAGELNAKLINTVKEMIGCDGGVALRSPSIALQYALQCMDFEKDTGIMLSALAPAWQIITVEKMGLKPIVLDVCEETGLITVENVENGIKEGGRLLVLTESMGVLPDIQAFLELGVPIIEDISHSALAEFPLVDGEDKPKKSGMYGVYTIFGMEDNDLITSGGGAVLFAPSRREWIVLKKLLETAPTTDIMSDMNAALAVVQLKEYKRNEAARKEIFKLYQRAISSGRHKTFTRDGNDENTSIYFFPLVLNSGFKEVKSVANKRGVEIRYAYENSIIALRQEELASSCICANSLLLRTAMFPLYPRLGQKDVATIVRTLACLP